MRVVFWTVACISLAEPVGAMLHGMYGSYPMGRDATGTSWMPDSTKIPAIERTVDEWALMANGFLMAVYDDQGGPRGGSKFFSENMLMATAQRDAGRGTFAVRSMISFEPATIGCNGYPLLLQTGETCNGETPLVDRQHPHDFLMELAGVCTLRWSPDCSTFAYFGYPGEPALGPPAYIHRFSAFFNPEAPITHHFLDSTHISFGVATLGLVHRWLKIDASLFNGREPDQHRWGFEPLRLNSWSVRLSANPTEAIAAQASYGHLRSPEALEPEVNTHRATASVSYNQAWNTSNWQITAAWGMNRNVPGNTLNGFLLESAVEIDGRHVLFGRAEYAAKDELFLPPSPHAGKTFRVGKADLGYLFEFPFLPYTRGGAGLVGSASFVPGSIRSAYGGTPLSTMVFLRIELIDTAAEEKPSHRHLSGSFPFR